MVKYIIFYNKGGFTMFKKKEELYSDIKYHNL